MIRLFAPLIVALVILLPTLAATEPIKLKLSYYSSDRTFAYKAIVEPFVTAVNAEGRGVVEIEVYFSGALSRSLRDQPTLVLDGKADIAFVATGLNPERFPDTAVIELPGLFRDVREATLVYTRLAHANVLAGHKDFFTIGALASAPQPIHSRKPLTSLSDLKDQRIRVNNLTEAVALAKLGASPIVLAVNETASAVSRGIVDGSSAATAQLLDSGIGRLVTNHYLLGVSSAALALVMNRQAFERLPEKAKKIIRKYSDEWIAERFIEMFDKSDRTALQELKTEPRRRVVVPSPADQEAAQRVFKSVVDGWAAPKAQNRALLNSVEAELAKIRAEQ